MSSESKNDFDQEVARLYEVLCAYYRILRSWLVEYAPTDPEDTLHPHFVEATHKTKYIEYLLDLLVFGTHEEKENCIADKKKELVRLENRLKFIELGNNCGRLFEVS